MNGTSSTIERRNQRISARLRRIQGQLASIDRSLASAPDYATLLQRIAAARGAMNGLMADLIEERLRSLPLDDREGVQDAIEETVDIVHSYLT
jgi:DNA-binding FrmR family transcriptional regulator